MLALATLKVMVVELESRLAVAVLIQPLAGLVAVRVNTPLPEATGFVMLVLLSVPPAGVAHV
jgi:hypothetical protein